MFRVDKSVARCPARDQVLSYFENDRDGEHSYTYRRMTCDDVYLGFYDLPLYHDRFQMSGQVALSPDGDQAIGQRRRKDGGYELVELPLRTRSLTGKIGNFLRRAMKLTPRQIVKLPQPADAFDLGPNGKIAVAMGKSVHLYDREHGLTPWKTFQDTIQDVQYLDDGTLAVLTEKRMGPDFHLFQGEESLTLPFRQVDPQHHARLLENRCQGVDLGQDLKPEERERFLDNSQWLQKEIGGWKPHQSLGPGLVAVHDGPAPTLWSYDASRGVATATTRLQAHDLIAVDPGRKLALSPSGSHLLQLNEQPGHVPVWETRTGHLLAVLPHVREVALTEEGVRFIDPAGTQHQVALEEIGSVKNQPWYRKALTAGLLDSQPVTTGHGLRQEGDRLRVGGHFLRIRTRNG